MRLTTSLALMASLTLASLGPGVLHGQRASPPAAHVTHVALSGPPVIWRTNYERRAAIIRGIRWGALSGMLLGTAAGALHAELRDDHLSGGFTVIAGAFAGLIGGSVAGGIVAARRYDARHGLPPSVALHLTGSHPAFRPLDGWSLGTHLPASTAPAAELGR